MLVICFGDKKGPLEQFWMDLWCLRTCHQWTLELSWTPRPRGIRCCHDPWVFFQGFRCFWFCLGLQWPETIDIWDHWGVQSWARPNPWVSPRNTTYRHRQWFTLELFVPNWKENSGHFEVGNQPFGGHCHDSFEVSTSDPSFAETVRSSVGRVLLAICFVPTVMFGP